ncbi:MULTISPECIES: hypothetical protein [Acinetobacter]|uniref:Uncharacterized protein n=1 Tax=Acinetobacter indicus TaxID=756892 RepID=A0A6C0Y739_9GAMM|nr:MULTISPECIES: hypothetical protein [Acinetobacter]QIC72077.1 hypothetical protein FSC09_17110 [Acinetobacter indicus]QKQ71522.1 hypothetical protein E5Y90_14920 [Acinetobacter sp. 10FS3-1]
MHINNLTADQIAEINAFLANGNNASFDEKTINFFNAITQPDNDPIGLIGNCEIALRGQIITLEDSNRYSGFAFPTQETPEVLNALYRDEMEAERDQYSDEDFEALCNEHLADRKAAVPQHALVLRTASSSGVLDLLFLNSEFKPIAVTMLKLKYL